MAAPAEGSSLFYFLRMYDKIKQYAFTSYPCLNIILGKESRIYTNLI